MTADDAFLSHIKIEIMQFLKKKHHRFMLGNSSAVVCGAALHGNYDLGSNPVAGKTVPFVDWWY